MPEAREDHLLQRLWPLTVPENPDLTALALRVADKLDKHFSTPMGDTDAAGA